MQQYVLRLNALSCLVFGLLFAIQPKVVTSFLGDPPTWIVAGLGWLLVLNALHLVWSARRKPSVSELVYFAVGDFLWVGVTIVLLVTGTWILTGHGRMASLAVAAMVAIFGVLQLWFASRPCRS